MTQIHDLSAVEQAAAVRSRVLSPIEIIDHYLERIDRIGPEVGAFFTVTGDLAREQARKAERMVAEAAEPSELPPLLGVPVPVKDLNMAAGIRLTYGSAVFADSVADADDHVVAALRAAGAVIPGKTATPEFGLPCYTETKVGPPARTPWDLSRSAGGSSGGAGAAVAAGLAPVAQGSDGGGSIRIPSSVCGLFGIKATRGRVSHAPLVPDLSGLSVEGPLARTVADAALLLDVLTGNEPGDMYTPPPLPPGETFLGCAARDPGRLRIGRIIDPVVPGAEVHPDCHAAWEDASALLADLGHEVVDMPAPFTADVVPLFETLWYGMAALMPVDPAREGELLPLTRYLRERGRATSAPDLIFAQAYLQIMVRRALPSTNAYDALLTPTLAQPPVPVGYFSDQEPAEDFERQKRFTPFAAVYNVSGQPAVNVPLYWNAGGLPIGVMLGGRMGEEGRLISLSAQLEAARPWRDRHPALW
ncbi:MAG TPA: amidase [Streptosporangiaceae bacterium]|nr:amidase [Streptosporangiaceae bacterium]